MSGSKAALAFALTMTACFGDFRLVAANLQVAPNPAVPGDVVVASFDLLLTPTQPHTVIVTIDGTEHTRVTSNEAPPRPYLITLGDAADLISAYGVGAHSARVEVRADEENESTRTQSAAFELRQSAP
jgi:hypothetical protein